MLNLGHGVGRASHLLIRLKLGSCAHKSIRIPYYVAQPGKGIADLVETLLHAWVVTSAPSDKVRDETR